MQSSMPSAAHALLFQGGEGIPGGILVPLPYNKHCWGPIILHDYLGECLLMNLRVCVVIQYVILASCKIKDWWL